MQLTSLKSAIEHRALRVFVSTCELDQDGRITSNELEHILNDRTFIRRFNEECYNARMDNPIVHGHPWEKVCSLCHFSHY